MNKSILAEIDEEIARLQEARALLVHVSTRTNHRQKRATTNVTKKHHSMSEEGRERVRQAQLKRWAVIKKKAKRVAAR
jgi:tetraacyldisaccharide-1-P 4'-kinase